MFFDEKVFFQKILEIDLRFIMKMIGALKKTSDLKGNKVNVIKKN